MRNCKLKRKLLAIYERLYTLSHDLSRWVVLRTKYRLRIMSTVQTLKYIKRTGCSVARFGDGELSFALKSHHTIRFQKNSDQLALRLQDTLANTNPNLLLCLPRYLNTLRGCSPYCKKYWWGWGKVNDKHKRTVTGIRSIAPPNYRFGDALISRPYMDTQDFKYASRIFNLLQELWQDRNILIVEGDQTRLGVGNDLFDNAQSIRRIIAPAVDAFDCYAQIKEVILKYAHNDLVLLALGPTATILAADLTEHHIQALDLGHVDIEYEWFRMKATDKFAVPGKYVNEMIPDHTFTECNDPRYLSQIIEIVK